MTKECLYCVLKWAQNDQLSRKKGNGNQKKSQFFPKYGWVGWLIPKLAQITSKIAFFYPNFTFCVPKSHKNPGAGSNIWESFPNGFIFWGLPSCTMPGELRR